MNALKNARNKAGLTQEELGKKLGLSKSTYCLLEAGKIKMTIDRAEKISKVLGVSPMIFFTQDVCNNKTTV